MTREEFVESWTSNSGLPNYTLDGELVTISLGNGETWRKHALECHCGEEGCNGWAMVSDGNQNFHKFQNGLTDMTFQEACAADAAIDEAVLSTTKA